MELDLNAASSSSSNRHVGAMGLPLDVAIEETADGVRVNLDGRGGEVLVARRGEPLKALQHVVDMAFRRELDGERRFVVDASATARARTPSCSRWRASAWRRRRRPAPTQEIGPLNPYERRIVHMAVAEDPGRDLGEHRRRVPEDGRSSRSSEPKQRPAPRALSATRQARMFSTDDTIVAIATPPGRGGIGVVRLSGRERSGSRPR